MPMRTINELNQVFGIPGKISFDTGHGERIYASLQYDNSRCEISLYGAQVLSCYLDRQQILWLSPMAEYKPGRAIRGGIPLCWPWFGPNTQNPDLPAHGFGRIRDWEVCGSGQDEQFGCYLDFKLQLSEPGLSTCLARMRIALNQALHLNLQTINTDSRVAPLSMAFHSYFTIGDIRQLSISGLEQTEYLDKVDQGKRKKQSDSLCFTGETDRVYVNSESTCIIRDPVLERNIRVEKQGSASTVVWNPWHDKAVAMADFPDSAYQHMVCIEAANTADNEIQLAPGDSQHMSCHISLVD